MVKYHLMQRKDDKWKLIPVMSFTFWPERTGTIKTYSGYVNFLTKVGYVVASFKDGNCADEHIRVMKCVIGKTKKKRKTVQTED